MYKKSAFASVKDTVNVCTMDSSYTFGDTTFTASTLYTYSQLNDSGCMDYHTLRISLNNHPVYDTTTVSVCSSRLPYEFKGGTYYAAGSFNRTLKNQSGCDSAYVTLNLTVIPDNLVTESITVTRNAIPYMYHDSALVTSGVYSIRETAANMWECDTIYMLNFTVKTVCLFRMSTWNCFLENITNVNRRVIFLSGPFFGCQVPFFPKYVIFSHYFAL